MGTKIWVDDERGCPPGWWQARDYREALEMIRVASRPQTKHEWERLSLDHDLGQGKSGYDVALYLAEHELWPTKCVTVHSHNPVGARRICGVVNRYGPYKTECIWTPYGSYRCWELLGEWEMLSKDI